MTASETPRRRTAADVAEPGGAADVTGGTALDAAPVPNVAADRAAVASQWQLVWWRLTRHKVAMASGFVILMLYVLAIFAGFFAPYGANERDFRNAYMPPQGIHFVSDDGFRLRPFVYGISKEMSMVTGRTLFTQDTSERYDVQFFVRGEDYDLMGLIPTDIHLYGVEDAARSTSGAPTASDAMY